MAETVCLAPAPPTGERAAVDNVNPPVGDAITRVQAQGHAFDVPDLATLQRWILEERVRPDDLYARDGGPWVPLHTRAELAIFFSAAARLSESPAAIERLVAPPLPTTDDAERATTIAGPPAAAAAPSDRDDALERSPADPPHPQAPEPREAPTIVSAPDLSRDLPVAASPFGGPPVRPLGDFGPSPGVVGTTDATPEPENAFDFPAVPDDDVFTDAPPREPARAARGIVTAVVVVLAVFGVFAGVRLFGSSSHARPSADAEPSDAPAPAAAPPIAADAASALPPASPPTAAASEAPAVPAATAAADPAAAPTATVPAGSPATPAPAVAAAPSAPAPAPKAPAPPREKSAPSTPASTTKSTRPSSSGVPQRMLSEGWKAVEAGDFEGAHDRFSLALQGKASAGALYGRGYASEKLGRKSEAGSDYCRALGLDADVDLTREIQSGLRRIGHGC